MRSLGSRPSRHIEEDVFIPSERKSSLRSQSFTPQQSKLRSTPNTRSSLSTTQTNPPKRYYISDTDNDESEEEILYTPTKKAKTSRLARTRKALTSYPSPPSSQDEYNYSPISAEKMHKKTTKIPTVTLVDLPLEVSDQHHTFILCKTTAHSISRQHEAVLRNKASPQCLNTSIADPLLSDSAVYCRLPPKRQRRDGLQRSMQSVTRVRYSICLPETIP